MLIVHTRVFCDMQAQTDGIETIEITQEHHNAESGALNVALVSGIISLAPMDTDSCVTTSTAGSTAHHATPTSLRVQYAAAIEPRTGDDDTIEESTFTDVSAFVHQSPCMHVQPEDTAANGEHKSALCGFGEESLQLSNPSELSTFKFEPNLNGGSNTMTLNSSMFQDRTPRNFLPVDREHGVQWSSNSGLYNTIRFNDLTASRDVTTNSSSIMSSQPTRSQRARTFQRMKMKNVLEDEDEEGFKEWMPEVCVQLDDIATRNLPVLDQYILAGRENRRFRGMLSLFCLVLAVFFYLDYPVLDLNA